MNKTKGMEKINDDILKKIMRSGVSGDIDTVIKIESEAAVGDGENYCSKVLRTKLELKLTSGKLISKAYVTKHFLDELGDEAEEEMRKYFTNEIVMYDRILIHLEKLAKDYNFCNSRIWPRCYYTDPDLLIFDDLKEEGYFVFPRQRGLRINEAKDIIRHLGRLHGLSVVAERRNLIDPTLIRKPYTWVNTNNFTAKVIRNSFRIVGDIVFNWGAEWEEAGKKITEHSKTISQTLLDLFNEEVKLRVVNHGDAWTSNIMVKYSSDNTIQSVRFVDFQNATYNSYGWDLIYFLYSSFLGDEMIRNYDLLLTCYRDEFVETLVKLNEDPFIAPTMQEIEADIVRLNAFRLTITCFLQAVVFNDSKEAVKIDELVTDESKFRKLYTSERMISNMKVYIKYFQEHNVL